MLKRLLAILALAALAAACNPSGTPSASFSLTSPSSSSGLGGSELPIESPLTSP